MRKRNWLKIPVFLVCLTPALWLAWRFWHEDLTLNPLEYITHFTGDWTIRFLALVLAVTPLRRLLGVPALIKYRRMVGLFAFFYGALHFLTYLWLDKLFDLSQIWKDTAKRPFITAGFAAFVLMAPLAITSTAGWIRRLGGKRWRQLHRLVYVSALAGVVHYYWLVKSDVRLPLLYGAIVGVLLLYRVGAAVVGNRRAPRPARAPNVLPRRSLSER